jgi:hypothetical protein
MPKAPDLNAAELIARNISNISMKKKGPLFLVRAELKKPWDILPRDSKRDRVCV